MFKKQFEKIYGLTTAEKESIEALYKSLSPEMQKTFIKHGGYMYAQGWNDWWFAFFVAGSVTAAVVAAYSNRQK